MNVLIKAANDFSNLGAGTYREKGYLDSEWTSNLFLNWIIDINNQINNRMNNQDIF